MAVAGRYVSDELNTFEIMMYRSLIGFLLVLIFSAVTKKLHAIQMGYLGDHFFRNIFSIFCANEMKFILPNIYITLDFKVNKILPHQAT